MDTFCVASNYVLTTKSFYPSKALSENDKSEFISNCKYYTNTDSTVTCEVCKDNYVLRKNKKECLSSILVPNCVEAENFENTCLNCKEGYALMGSGVCVLGTINNCMTYYNN